MGDRRQCNAYYDFNFGTCSHPDGEGRGWATTSQTTCVENKHCGPKENLPCVWTPAGEEDWGDDEGPDTRWEKEGKMDWSVPSSDFQTTCIRQMLQFAGDEASLESLDTNPQTGKRRSNGDQGDWVRGFTALKICDCLANTAKDASKTCEKMKPADKYAKRAMGCE